MQELKFRPLFIGLEKFRNSFNSSSQQFWILVSFLGFVLLTGGSSRPDTASLIVLRPAAIALLAYGLCKITRPTVGQHRLLFVLSILILGLAVFHLIPLPPTVWMSIPGRTIIAEIDRVSGIGRVWRPLTMAPAFGWNALYSLCIPLGVLLNGAQLPSIDLKRLTIVVLLAGVASGLLAVVQILASSDGSLYFYQVTNRGDAVGFFANRNHQAVFLACLFPVLAHYGARRGQSRREDRRRLFTSLTAGAFIIPLLLVTGSRGGLAAGVVGLLSVPLVTRATSVRSKKPKKISRRSQIGIGLAFSGVVALTIWAILADRAQALTRALASDAGQEARYKVWGVVIDNLGTFMPFGSGIGSYERVFQVIEPSTILSPSYSNHVHNDWLEIVMTTGLPGTLLLTAIVAAFAGAIWRIARRAPPTARRGTGWMGLAIILMMAVSSAVDYPVRVPTLSALFVIACLWASHGSTAPKNAY